MDTLSKYFNSHRTIKKINVIEVPKVFCLAGFHAMQFRFAWFPHSLFRNVINFRKLFLLLHVERKSNLKCLFYVEVSIHKEKAKILLLTSICCSNHQKCTFLQFESNKYSLSLINTSNSYFLHWLIHIYIKGTLHFCEEKGSHCHFHFSFDGGWNTLFLSGGQESYYTLIERRRVEILLIYIKWTETYC